MTTQDRSASRTRPPILIAVWLLIIAATLITTSGLTGTAQAQAESGAIPSLTLESSEPGQLVITWEPPDSQPTDYRVRWAPTSANFLSYRDDNEAQRGNLYPLNGVNTLTLNNLTPGEEYKVDMRSRYRDGEYKNSRWSGPWTEVATQRAKDHPPAEPTGLTTSQISHDSLTLTWDDPQDDRITGYRIQRGTQANSLSTIKANTDDASTEYQDDNVAPETLYHYAILAISQDGDGPQSPTFSITTPAEPVQEEPVQEDPPATPTDLTASNVEHNSLTLTWNDPQDDRITGYRILRGIAYKNLPTIVEDTGSPSSDYTDNTVAQASAYFYQVVALRGETKGPKSATVEATTPAESIRSVPGRSTTPATETLVSNIDRATNHMAYLISRDLAQEFTTGPNPTGYKLSSIDIYLTGRGPDMTVKLFSGSASGSEVATLTSPGWERLGHNVYTFVPPPNTNLTASTSYWIVVKGTGNGWFKAAPGEDASPVPGWKLAETYDYRSKYIYNGDGTQSINTDLEFRQFTGSLSVRINRLNNVATGQPTISGTPKTQQILTASAAGIQDDDGLPATFDYQWMRYSPDGTAFETNVGAKSNEYRLAFGDEGKRIRVGITSFFDGKDNEEGPFLSNLYPSDNTVTAPLIYTMVSNIGKPVDSPRAVNISDKPWSQSFTTSDQTATYILTSATILSTDPEGDEFTVKICEVQGNGPTESCTDLDPPVSFTAGPLEFTSPSDRTITLFKGDTYALVFRVAAGTTVTLPSTDEDVEDPITLPGWSIRNKSQHLSNNLWMDRGHDVSYLIAIKGEPTQISQASGRPTIGGNPSVGQVLTASTESITVPEGVAGNFSYQWKRLSSNGSTFEADTGTNSGKYTLTTDELDKKVQVEVSFVDTRGSVVGFPLTSPAYPTGAAISAAPLMSNTSQSGNSNEPMSAEVGQSFTTGPSPHGHQLSSITIFYDDEEQRRVDLKVCETSSDGRPTTECWNLDRPRSFVPGPLHFNVPKAHFRVLNPNTTYAAVLNGPKPRTVETTVDNTCPQDDPDFLESCGQEVVITVIIAAQVGVTTSNGEDPMSSPGWSIRNAYQQNNEGAWSDIPSGASIRIAVHADVTPNKDATGTPDITGTARIGQTLTATTDDIGDQNGLPTTFTYQWKRHSAEGVFESDIGLNSDQYTLTSSDLNKKLQVEVSYTDLHGYSEGPLINDDFPHGDVVITTAEDDLLVSNTGNPESETVQTTRKIAQVFAVGTNPNGYHLTSVTVSGNSAPVKICRFESIHNSSPSSDCVDNPSPENPRFLRREWLYAVVIDPNTVNVTDIDEEDQTSRPHWEIRGKYQEQNQQGNWHNTAQAHAVRMELQGKPASPFTRLGQLAATPADQQVTLTWQSWTPNSQDVIQRIQHRIKQVDQPWNPDWTDIPGSNGATETHTIRNLTNGIEHTIQIRAVFDQDGQTVYSGSASINATPRAPLTAPNNLDASTEGDGGVRLSWSDPADSTLTRYQYRYRNTSDNGWNPDWTSVPGSNAATTSHTLTGLAKNLRHTLEVRTLRGDEQGPAASSSVTPRGPMPRLQNLSAMADDQEATLSWDNPGDHGITGYQYRHQAASESVWNPDWTRIPSSNASTTSHRVRPLINVTAYTFEVRAVRGLEEGRASRASATTPDGPATIPNEPTRLRIGQREQGFNALWGRPSEPDERAPVTSYQVRHRQVGTSSWQNVTVDDCCAITVTGLTNRRHYEVEVAAVNRLGTSPWAGPVNVTPQPPYTEPPAPTGDPDLSLGTLGPNWTTSDSGNDLNDSCTGTRNFRIIWTGPKDHARGADQWAAHINTSRGAGEVTYAFRKSPGERDYYEMNGTVSFQGTGTVSLKLRGRFGQTWGTWSPTGTLFCHQTE